jgi:peptide/nickel transport system substrate-binding protein
VVDRRVEEGSGVRLRLLTGLLLVLMLGSVAGVAAQEPAPGGDLVFVRGRDIASLDPMPVGDTDTIYSLNHLYETLYIADPEGNPIPQLATGYTVSDDQLTWTFTLREGVKFHDGSDLDSADVKFSIERATPGLEPNPDGAAFGFINAAIESVEAPDPLTVVIKTKFPWSPMLADVVGFINYIVPADFGGKTEEEFFANPVGTGPFMFDGWDKGVELRLVKNPDYWKEGQPYLDSVTWRVVGDDNTRLLQLQGGEAHVNQEVPYASLEALAAADETEAAVFPAETTQYVLLNVTQPPLDDVHARRAIAYAIDRQAIVDAVLLGNGEVANSFMSPQIRFYDPESPGIQFDLDKAREELAMSSVPDGFDLEITTTSDYTLYLDIATILQAQLAEIGVNVTLRPVEFTNLYSTISSGDFQAAMEGWTSDIPDPDEQVSFMADFVSAQSYSTNWDDEEVKAWVSQAQQAFDDASRAELYANIQRKANEDVPWVNLYYQGLPYAWSSDVNGFQVGATGAYRLEDVWLSQ